MQSKPSPNPSDYPPVAEVRQWFDAARQNVLDWYGSLSAAELAMPLPEPLQHIAPDRLRLIARLAVHESGHGGQLTVIRKSLALPPVFA